MEETGSYRSALESVFGDLRISSFEGGAVKAGQRADEGCVDVSAEDAEIAALMAGLADDHKRLDEVGHQLRERSLDADTLVAEQLVPIPSVPSVAPPETCPRNEDPSVVRSIDSSDSESESATAFCAPAGLPKNALRSEGNSDAWNQQRTAMLSLGAATLDPSKNYGYPPLKPKGLGDGDCKASTGKLGAAPPLNITPEMVIFEDCNIGGSFEVRLTVQNVSKVGLSLRILPCTNRAFSSEPLRYDGATRRKLGAAASTGMIPPGISAFLTVRFTPKTLDDQSDQLVIATDLGNASVQVRACGVQPPSLKVR